jgi:hypothetical protein
MNRSLFTLALLCSVTGSHISFAEQGFGLTNLVPQRYLNQVRKGSEDKLPEVPANTERDFIPPALPQAGQATQFAAARPVSAPPKVSVEVPKGSYMQTFLSAAGGAEGTADQDAASLDKAAANRGFIAGSIGDAPSAGGVTGLGAGWSDQGERQPLASETRILKDSSYGAPGGQQTAADRLVASVSGKSESQAPGGADSISDSEKGESYRSLTSVLAFQEMPRGNNSGNSGSLARPKSFWKNPDPSRKVRSSAEALNTLHNKEVMGDAAASYRRSTSGGPITAAAEPAAKAAEAQAVPFQVPGFTFPMPGMTPLTAE